MDKPTIDMHMHSNVSDGSNDPEKIPWIAKRNGLKGICLTDHDCHLGLPEFMAAAPKYGIEAIAGIEMSCKFEGVDVHIIGFGIDFRRDCFFRNRLEKHWEIYKKRTEMALQKYIQLGLIPLHTTLEEIRKNTGSRGPWVSVMHIRAYSAKLLGQLYKESIGVMPRNEATYIDYDDPLIMTPQEGMDFIEEVGGIPVLAHPDEFLRRTNGTPEDAEKTLFKVLDMLQERKQKGIEVFHPSHTQERRKYFYEIARKRGFLITAGSDYHGDFKPNVPMGMVGVTFREFLEFKRLCEN